MIKNFYVVGSNTSKSLSPDIFNYWFKKYNLSASYGYIEVKENGFDKKIKSVLKKKDTMGLNVTIPYKAKILKFLEKIDKHSEKINAVNCLVVKNSKTGINTDWSGYEKTLPKNLKKKGANVIILGYGGASKAIHYSFSRMGHKEVRVFNRRQKKLKFLAKTKFSQSYNTINKYLDNCDLLINTTPINPLNAQQTKLVKKKTVVSDIVYMPKNTIFLNQFKKNKKIYGIEMLLEQASLCFDAWFGFTPIKDKKLYQALNKKIK
tara:strand:- start:819 stop:1607 length:789 start_codon:yes stop_codon:yes gene_type:complete